MSQNKREVWVYFKLSRARHSRVSGNPNVKCANRHGIPACAGMTGTGRDNRPATI
jgi:hypothetical protein